MSSVSLILLVLATTLICDDSLGGEPNDRIDQVLAVMVKMAAKMNDMEKTIDDVKKQVEKVDSDVNNGVFGYKFVGWSLIEMDKFRNISRFFGHFGIFA